MSEPWCPQPAPENTPGPHAELWTLVLRDTTSGTMRKVPVFARSLDEARAQLGQERTSNEMLIRVDRGGVLPPVRR